MDVFLIPFTVLWAGFAVFWTTMAIRQNAGVVFLLFGSVFVVIGLYISVGRFFLKAFGKRRTHYILTTRRALIIRGGSRNAVSLVPGMTRETRARGRRIDVIFGPSQAGASPFMMWGVWANSGLDFLPGMPTAFYDVNDVAGLASALQRQQAVEFRQS